LRKDSVFSSRAVFIDEASLIAASNARVRRSLEELARFFRIATVGKKGSDAQVLEGIVHAAMRDEEIPRFTSRNAIELYASWCIGDIPDLGFKGVLPGGAEDRVSLSLKAIRTAEARSRIIIDYGRLERLAASIRRRGARVVFTNGVFDLMHIGHLRLLEMAKRLGDILIVGINSDDSTRMIKGESRPVVPQFARAKTLSDLRAVDYCCIFTETDPKRILAIVRPDVLAKGSDYSLRRIVGGRYVEGYGGVVVRLPLIDGFSTTSTISRILEKQRNPREYRSARKDAQAGETRKRG